MRYGRAWLLTVLGVLLGAAAWWSTPGLQVADIIGTVFILAAIRFAWFLDTRYGL